MFIFEMIIMGAIKTIKRLASDILGVGKKRVKVKNITSDDEKKQLSEAITRENVRDLIKDKILIKKDVKGVKKKKRKKKRTPGNRKGKKYSIVSEKERWMERVRAQRKYLRELLNDGSLDQKDKRKIYLRIKGGSFRSKHTLYLYLEDNKLLLKKKK